MAKGNRTNQTKTDMTAMAGRLRVVEGMIHRCLTHQSIQSTLSKQWGITTRQIRTYIKKVYDAWAEDAKELAVDRVDQRRGQFEGLLEKAMLQTPPDIRIAVICLDRLCKIDGSYAATEVKVEVDHTVKHMTSSEKRNELAELIAEANKRAKSNGHDKSGRDLN